jgi:ATP-binding cassette subfamily B protein
MIKKLTLFLYPFLRRIRLLQSNLNLSKTLRLIWSVEKKWTIYNLVMIIIETGAFFFSIYWLKLLIDSVSNSGADLSRHKEAILYNIFIAGLSAILYIVAKSVSAYVTETQSAKVAEYLDDKIHESATRLDLSFYESPDYFDILKRAKDAGADRPALVIKTLSEIVKNTLTFLALAAILITIDWRLIPMLFLFVLPIFIVKLSFADKLNVWRIKHTPAERQATYLGSLITSETAAKEIRSYRLGHYFRSLYLQIRLTLLNQRLSISRKRTKNEIITAAVATAGFFACVGYIALQTLGGHTTVGDITLFLVVFPQSFSVMQNIAAGITIVYQNNIYINSIFDLFALRSRLPESEYSRPIAVSQPQAIEMRNVSFTYPHSTKPALSNINLKIPAGKIVGLVGLNGAGKTTLIKLLCRLYDVSSGQICMSGCDIRDLKTDEYRQQIGIVFQDFVKYNFSAGENIRFGAIDARHTEEDITAASVKAGAHDFISRLPEGYQSMMGRLFAEGNEISTGQWQKIAIARAFYSKAPVLIFDEATSALDAAAEKALFDTLRENIGNRSALIISHRHSAVKHADYIYVLEEGRIVQEGTNGELLEEKGVYAQLFKEEAFASENLLQM